MMNNNNENIIAQDLNTIIGYNPFLNTKKGIGRLGKKAMISYNYYIDMLTLLTQIAYKWENIPDEIPNYQMEKCLCLTGSVGLTYDNEINKYVALPCVIYSGGLDIYGEGKQYKLFSYSNTYNKIITKNEDGVICWNNNIKKSNIYMILRYAERLQLIDEIIDLNIKQQKSPYILICDEKTKTTLKTILSKIELGEESILTTKELDLENVLKPLELNVELKAHDLIEAKREIFNEACMYLGISANLSNKKERLIASEVATEEKRYDIYRQIGLEPRKYFCKLANKLYNLNLDVNYVLDEKELNEMNELISDTDVSNRADKIKKAKKIVKDK